MIWIVVSSFVMQEPAYVQTKKAFEAGNATAIGELLSNSIDLKTDKVEGVYVKEQSIKYLQDFFKSNLPKSFVYVHKGNSTAGAVYAIGNFTSQNKSTYRVYLKYKKVSDTYLIDTIEIEQE